MGKLFDRVFKALEDAHYIEETKPGQFAWRDENDARQRFKRFHADPIKYAQYIEVDLLGLIGDKPIIEVESRDHEIALLQAQVAAQKLENQATNSLLRDEAERRRIAEEKLYTIKRLLEPEYPFQRPPNLNAPFYRQLQQFGHLGVPVYAPSLAFWAKKVESYDSGKVIANVNVLAYNDGRVGADRQLKPGDLVRAVDGQVWQILAPMESQS